MRGSIIGGGRLSQPVKFLVKNEDDMIRIEITMIRIGINPERDLAS